MRRAARLAVGVLAALLALLAFAVGVTSTVLRTRWGGDLARRLALPRVNAAIAGHVEVGSFSFGGDHFTLEDIALFDPEGVVVARVGRLTVAFSPWALVHEHVELSRIAIAEPSLSLRSDARGLDLSRALAPRHPRSASTKRDASKEGGSGLVVDVGALFLSDGLVDLRSVGQAKSALRVTSLTIAADAHYDGAADAFTADVRLDAEVREPVSAPLTVRLRGQGRGERRELVVSSTLGDSSIDATLRTDAARRATLNLTRAVVGPEIVRAFLPQVRLLVPLRLAGDASQDGSTAKVALELEGAGGAIDVRGAIDMSAHRIEDVSVTATRLDLGRWLDGLPRSDLSIAVQAAGGGPNLGALDGDVVVDMRVGRLDGAPVGPANIHIAATHGIFELRDLDVVLPGLTVTGHGALGPGQLGVEVSVDAHDLGRTSATLSSLRVLRAPPFSGRGKVTLTIDGTATAPGVSATATFPRLTVAGNDVRGAKLEARVRDIHTPEIGSVDVHVARGRFAGHDVRDVAIRVRSTARRLALVARAGGPTPLSLDVSGSWTRPWESFDLGALALRYPGMTWRLQRPARLSLRSDHLTLTAFSLRARDQKISGDLDKQGDRFRAHVAAEQLDLGALPRLLAPPNLPLAGRLDVHADVAGTLERPTGRATVALQGGRVGRYKDLSLRLDGRFGGDRATGEVEAQGMATSMRARFDLPFDWPLRRERGPVELALTVPEIDLGTLEQIAGSVGVASKARVSGKLGLSLDVHGTVDRPSLVLSASARGLVIDDQKIGALSIRVSGGPAQPLGASLQMGDARAAVGDRLGSPLVCGGSLQVRTDLAVPALTKKLPTARELLRTHFDVAGDVRGLPLRVLARLVRSPEVSGGFASVRLAAEGTALAPTGALNVSVIGATGPRFPPTNGRLDAAFGARDTRLAVRVVRGDHELASASAILGLPARRLADRRAIASASLRVRAALGPLALQRADVPILGAGEAPQTLSATLSAALSIDGTPGWPEMKLSADVSDARLGDRPVGGARAIVSYAARRADVDVQFDTTIGGALRLAAHGAVDLGYPEVLAGLNVTHLPFSAALTAKQFNLGWLSGLSESVRQVGGQLTATIKADRKLGALSASGQLEWVKGTLDLRGLGGYRDVHLKAHGNERAIWLDDLHLASGEGTAKLTAGASRTSASAYNVKGNLSTRQFPIYGQGQPLAVVSIDGSVTGSVSATEARTALTISEAHVELTDAKRKDLEPLARPPDVILLDDGAAIDRAEKVKLAALPESLGGTLHGDGDEGGAPPHPPLAIRLAIDAPRNLWVNGEDAALELGLGPNFRVVDTEVPRVYGQVLVRRGRINVLGRRFDLQAGSAVDFIGPPGAPRLDVSAQYFNDTENITVLLKAKGTLDHLSIAVSSPERPDLTEGQLYTLIVTGRLQFAGNTAGSASPSGEAASLVGGLVAAQLQKALAKRLPLDVLTLQAGEGLSGSRLEAGTYVTSKLYAGYVGRVGANPALLQNRNAVHLEYQLSRRWSFDGEYGDVGTGTADLIWTKSY